MVQFYIISSYIRWKDPIANIDVTETDMDALSTAFKTQEQDELKELYKKQAEIAHEQQAKVSWKEISVQINRLFPKIVRTGKQCRERWHNHLCDTLYKNKPWEPDEERALFDLQRKLGNHWAEIADQLKGRSDNAIKNHFYCSLRKCLRKINSALPALRREQPTFRAIKEFPSELLSKILTVSEDKYHGKMFVTSQEVAIEAQKIKNNLLKVALGDVPKEAITEVIERLHWFRSNCKRRKNKKKEPMCIERNVAAAKTTARAEVKQGKPAKQPQQSFNNKQQTSMSFQKDKIEIDNESDMPFKRDMSHVFLKKQSSSSYHFDQEASAYSKTRNDNFLAASHFLERREPQPNFGQASSKFFSSGDSSDLRRKDSSHGSHQSYSQRSSHFLSSIRTETAQQRPMASVVSLPIGHIADGFMHPNDVKIFRSVEITLSTGKSAFSAAPLDTSGLMDSGSIRK